MVWVPPGLVDTHSCGHGSQVEPHTGPQQTEAPGQSLAVPVLVRASSLLLSDPTQARTHPPGPRDPAQTRTPPLPGAPSFLLMEPVGASEPSAIRWPPSRTPFSSCQRPHCAAAGSARSEAGVTEPQAHSSSCVPTVMAAQSVKSSVISAESTDTTCRAELQCPAAGRPQDSGGGDRSLSSARKDHVVRGHPRKARRVSEVSSQGPRGTSLGSDTRGSEGCRGVRKR